MDKKMLEYFSEKLLLGEGSLDFGFIPYGLNAKKIEKACYSVVVDFSDINLTKEEDVFLSEESDKVIETAVKEYLKQFELGAKADKYIGQLNSIRLVTKRLLPKSAFNKKHNFNLLRECGMADNPDHIIATNWNAKLPDILKEFCLANNEKIENNKALFDTQDEISALRIDENCLL
ncbi:MAG: hypothetical protein ACYCV8_06125, partial [bacterium]